MSVGDLMARNSTLSLSLTLVSLQAFACSSGAVESGSPDAAVVSDDTPTDATSETTTVVDQDGKCTDCTNAPPLIVGDGDGDGDSTSTGGSSSGPSPEPPAQCEEGLLNGGGTVCCPLSCGTCGGSGCSERPGGNEACCAGAIVDSGLSCLDYEAPCLMDGASPAPGTGGSPGGDGDGDGGVMPPSDALYWNPLENASDVEEVQASLERDGTGGLLSSESRAPCTSGGCMSIRHDYEGQNIKNRKVNGEYSMGASVTEATFTYDVFFESGFDFRKQGKLPGMIPAVPHFGGNAKDAPHPDKWSARVMWFKSGDADGNGEVRPDLYLYDQDRNQGQSGEHNNQGGFDFTTNTWHTVQLYLKLNSNGSTRDGRAELWVDDQLMACRTNKLFRGSTGSNTEIQRIAFHNYFGGSQDYDWPHEEQYSYFDSLEVVEGRNTPRTPSSGECESHVRNR